MAFSVNNTVINSLTIDGIIMDSLTVDGILVFTSSGWDISAPTFAGSTADLGFSVGQIYIKPDGTKAYIKKSGSIQQFTLTTPWDFTTSSNDLVNFNPIGSAVGGFYFKSDGTKIYVSNQIEGRVEQYTVTTPWSLASVSWDNNDFPLGASNGNASTVFFKPDGTETYILNQVTARIIQYTLTTPWDFASRLATSKIGIIGGQDASAGAFFFKPDGTKLWMSGNNTSSVYQYTLSTPWDITTLSYDNISFSVLTEMTDPRGLFFNTGGTRMYTGSQWSPRIVSQYDL